MLADRRAPLARHDQADRVMGRTARAGSLALAQPYGVAVERRHHGVAGRWIDVADRARAVSARRQRREQAPRALARVAVLRRMLHGAGEIGADEAGLGPQPFLGIVRGPELILFR